MIAVPASLNEINRTLGLVLGKLDGISKEIADIREDMTDSETKADTSRAGMHRRLDEVVLRTGHLETDVMTVKREVGELVADTADMKKVTDEVTQWKQRGIGALAFAGIAGTVLGGSAMALLAWGWDGLLKMLRSG